MTKDDFAILIVDDEMNIRDGLRAGLEDEANSIITAGDADTAIKIFRSAQFSVVITDVQMPGALNGLELTEQILSESPNTTIIVITAYGTVDLAVQAMRLGAYDFITKPIDLELIRHQVRKALAYHSLRDENRHLKSQLADAGEISGIVGHSRAMEQVFHCLRQVASTDATVLIHGESGTGKELIARSLHDLSDRSMRAFVAVNLGAVPDALLESEMFGHEKGAFTGAVRCKAGFFEQANGSTLFLDEVTEMSAKSQVDLLRVLETQSFRRVGGDHDLTTDIRVVAATNKEIGKLIREGSFREDLFYRLNVFPIFLPPLRDRPDDIPLLVEHFLNHFRQRYHRHFADMSPEAMQALIAAAWPGNVRQLRNIIERIVIMSTGDSVQVADLPAEVFQASMSAHEKQDTLPRNTSLHKLVADCEIKAIRAALATHDGHRERAAAQLGISLRTIHNKMSRYGLH